MERHLSRAKLRLRSEWLLVRCEPFQEKIGSLFIPKGSQRVRHGEVLQLGPKAHDLRVGERVAFFREHMETQQGKQIVRVLLELGDDLALLKDYDVLCAAPKGVEVSV